MSAQGSRLFSAITAYVEALVQHELTIHERDYTHKIRVGPPEKRWDEETSASMSSVGGAARALKDAIEDLVGR